VICDLVLVFWRARNDATAALDVGQAGVYGAAIGVASRMSGVRNNARIAGATRGAIGYPTDAGVDLK
jgi:hypothetical protein